MAPYLLSVWFLRHFGLQCKHVDDDGTYSDYIRPGKYECEWSARMCVCATKEREGESLGEGEKEKLSMCGYFRACVGLSENFYLPRRARVNVQQTHTCASEG